MIRKRLFCAILMLSVFVSVFAQERQHVVKPGDTLYSLSKKYNVTVEAIQAANPSVEGTNIAAGMTLIIPSEITISNKDEKKKEKTKFFNFKKNEQGKKNVPIAENVVEQERNIPAVEETVKKDDTVPVKRTKMWGAPDNIVVILPFNLDAQTSNDDKQQMRSVEFYEGLLLAVNEAQQAGQKILVQTYDLGTKSMAEILATKSLLDADIIVAPMDMEDVKQVAEFGKMNDIEVISPFVFSQELSKSNKNLVQLNTSKSLLYDNLTSDIVKRFEDYDFVFISDTQHASKNDPYADYLKNALRSRDIQFHEFMYDNPESLASVDSVLNIIDHNILYIPEANSKEALRRMFPCLKCTTFETGEELIKKGQTAILGYPEWVLYLSDFIDYYFDMNVHMFSKFYINPLEESVKTFYKDFRYWFAKEPMPLTPKYALLGYDIGKYFLSAMRAHGTSYGDYLDIYSCETLQSMMSFVHDGEGLINKGLYLVHFTPSTQIEKYEIK